MLVDEIAARLFVRSGAVVYDIGAMHGTHSGRYLLSGAAAVYAFEPLAENRDRMPTALMSDPRFHLLPFALAAESGSMPFHVPDFNPGAGSLSRGYFERVIRHYGGEGVTRAVEGRALDDLGLPRADFWKIDVEGAELPVLHGAARSLRENPPALIELELFAHDRQNYVDVLNLLHATFPHLWALGVTARGALIHYPVRPDVVAHPEFHRDLARAGTPHYYASQHHFDWWKDCAPRSRRA